MSTTGVPAFAPEWLALRENADAEARATEPLTFLHGHGRVVADLGCGTGALGRWLTPRLPPPQHWVLFDRDPVLLELARKQVPATGLETRQLDLASLRAADLAGVTLVVASALLDVLTRADVEALARAVVGTGCPALFTLSVTGRVEISPGDPRDLDFEGAFNDHQRRKGRLGPDSAAFTAAVFEHLGYTARTFPSPWRLGPGREELTRAWLRGWTGAAVEQDPSLSGADYPDRRLGQSSRGELSVAVHHADLLVLPRPESP